MHLLKDLLSDYLFDLSGAKAGAQAGAKSGAQGGSTRREHKRGTTGDNREHTAGAQARAQAGATSGAQGGSTSGGQRATIGSTRREHKREHKREHQWGTSATVPAWAREHVLGRTIIENPLIANAVGGTNEKTTPGPRPDPGRSRGSVPITGPHLRMPRARVFGQRSETSVGVR